MITLQFSFNIVTAVKSAINSYLIKLFANTGSSIYCVNYYNLYPRTITSGLALNVVVPWSPRAFTTPTMSCATTFMAVSLLVQWNHQMLGVLWDYWTFIWWKYYLRSRCKEDILINWLNWVAEVSRQCRVAHNICCYYK